ncbi:MAG: homoserine dehydrogenase [Clostridiales bacterium]|nr:homoserine dehydrogenase [Clostridiales bacterium]
MVKIAILGYGTVGSGIFEVIKRNQLIVNKKAADEIDIKYVLDLREFPGDPVESVLVHDFELIINDPEVSVICETMGGLKPAYDFTKRALEKGKSVCTSNKELVAAYGAQLIRIAKENNCNYLFEASVGGGIPIIRPLNYCLTPEKIEGITGILNGTTNYILTKMAAEGADFNDVLKEAQEKGYAEKDPTADIEAHDPCRKIAILSSLMYGKSVDYKDIQTEGITKITAVDFEYAKKLDYSIKLLATSCEHEGEYYALVAPFMIRKDCPLAFVNDVFNAVYVKGNMLDDTMYYGRGAGKLPTASAVVSDVIDCARHLGKSVMCFWDEEKVTLSDNDRLPRRFFIRFRGTVSESLAKIEAEFGKVQVTTLDQYPGEFAVVTAVITEKIYKSAVSKMDNLIGMLRVDE